MKLIAAALLAVACGGSKPVGGCGYEYVNGTCELRGVTVGELDPAGHPVAATYAWRGPLPPRADPAFVTRVLDWRVRAAEVDAFRAQIEARPEVACQLEIGACPQMLVILPIDGVATW